MLNTVTRHAVAITVRLNAGNYFNLSQEANKIGIHIMYQSITFSSFCDAFHHMGRADQFTYKGKRALFDYIEQFEEDAGQPIELDVIALCCEYSEDDLTSVLESYSLESLDDLHDNTSVISYDESTGLVLFAQF